MQKTNLKIIHKNNWLDRFTLVTEKIDVPFLLDTVSEQLVKGEDIELYYGLGVSRCHPDDQFNKKTGVKLALDKMEICSFKVKSVFFKDDRVNFILTTLYQNELRINLAITVFKDSKKIRYMNAEYYKAG